MNRCSVVLRSQPGAPESGGRCPLSSPTQTAEIILDQLTSADSVSLWGGKNLGEVQLFMTVWDQRCHFQFGGKVWMSRCAQEKGRPKKLELISSLLQFAKKKKKTSDVTRGASFPFFFFRGRFNKISAFQTGGFQQRAKNTVFLVIVLPSCSSGVWDEKKKI